MAWTPWVILGAWLFWSAVCRNLARGQPRRDPGIGEEALLALAAGFNRAYVRLLHRVRYVGAEHAPRGRDAGPLIVVVNHTAGVDPLLVQAALDFEVRWMMAKDMRLPALDPVWRLLRIIGVERNLRGDRPRDSRSLREALAHLREGGIVGVFPEGRIERPRGALLRFHEGVGLLAGLSGAPVLPVLVQGTPDARTAWGSLVRPSRSVVTFGRLMDGWTRDAAENTARIRRWFEEQLAAA